MIIRDTGHGFRLEDPKNFRALKLILAVSGVSR